MRLCVEETKAICALFGADCVTYHSMHTVHLLTNMTKLDMDADLESKGELGTVHWP